MNKAAISISRPSLHVFDAFLRKILKELLDQNRLTILQYVLYDMYCQLITFQEIPIYTGMGGTGRGLPHVNLANNQYYMKKKVCSFEGPKLSCHDCLNLQFWGLSLK